MKHKHGDVLMLTEGPAAGCLVRVDEEVVPDLPYFPDSLLKNDFQKYSDIISSHNIKTHGELAFGCVKLCEWL